jgi:hypothetical protein
MEINYRFDEETPPREIFLEACLTVASFLESNGFKFLKSKKEIVKKIDDFEFLIAFWSSDSNGKGYRVRLSIGCSIKNKKHDERYFGNNLGYIANIGWREWELYGKDNYENSLKTIIDGIENSFLPLTERFTNDIENLVLDVVENGFYPNNRQVGYRTNIDFLSRYGNRELLEKSIQKYYDTYISKHYEVHEKFKKVLFELKNGQEIDPFLLREDTQIVETIVSNNLDIKIKA